MRLAFKPLLLFSKQLNFGVLTICPTPIGHLQDISIRMQNALFQTDVIACEDTRRTGMLLQLLKQKKHESTPYIEQDELEVLVKKEEETQKEEEDELLKTEILKSKDLAQIKKKYQTKQDLTIQDLSLKADKLLLDKDPFKVFIDQEKFEKAYIKSEEDDTLKYGLDDAFYTFIKKKILISKQAKGRPLLISCHNFNEQSRINTLLSILKYGFNLTLVSDAGTPTISDPGYKIINACYTNQIQVSSIPGPNAITTALSLSGYPADDFNFLGYASKNQNDRLQQLQNAKNLTTSAVIFENYQRLNKLLLSIEAVYGPKQQILIAVEMTKLHEKCLRGTTSELYTKINDLNYTQSTLKGEIVIVIAPYKKEFNIEALDSVVSQQTANVDVESLIKILNFKIELADSDLLDLVYSITKVDKKTLKQLIFQVRHQEKVERNRKELMDSYLNKK